MMQMKVRRRKQRCKIEKAAKCQLDNFHGKAAAAIRSNEVHRDQPEEEWYRQENK